MTASQQTQKQSWHRSRIVGPKPPFNQSTFGPSAPRLAHDGQVRDLAKFNVAIDSKRRGFDLVKFRVADIHPGDGVGLQTTVVQQKTGRSVPFEITKPTRDALTAWLKKLGQRPGDWLFPSRSHPRAKWILSTSLHS